MLNQDRSLRANTDKDGVKHMEKTNSPAMARIIDNPFVDSGSSPPTKKVGRNAPCHCGSGKKYKKCHERSDEAARLEGQEACQAFHNGEVINCAKADLDDYNNERNVAMHESGHAVAHWIMGQEISYVQFNDDRNDKGVHADKFGAVTVGGGTLPEIMALPIGERTVIARQHAFVTLAGVFGSTDAQSENPIRKRETVDHLFQAASKLVHFAGMSEEEAKAEALRLIPVVTECFDDPAIWNLVNILATILQKERRIEGAEVAEIINTAYPVCKAAVAEGKVAMLSGANA